VPRRAETFQADIFPPAIGLKPAFSAKDWLDGQTGLPSKIDFESIYEGNAPKEVPSDYMPPAQATPAPTPKPAPKAEEPKEAPKPAVVRSPPPSVADQKNSMSALANKFQDNEEEEVDEPEEEFEEITKRTQRSAIPSRAEAKPAAAPVSAPVPVRSQPVSSSPAPAPAARPAVASPTPAPAPAAATSTSSSGVESSLDQIKALIENQTRIISAQNDKIGQLATEVESLKKKVGSGSQDQSERIRQLELELEEARS
jgi:coronin-1B/1C/6